MGIFTELRENRDRWLEEIASVEAGNSPSITHAELGLASEDRIKYVARLREWVADVERHLAASNQPFDA
jgi:hypothetical protein